MELFKANAQWSKRPADETFGNVQTAYQAARAYAANSAEKEDVELSSIRVEADNGEVKLTGKGGIPARVSNWAFGQLSRIAGAPSGYLRNLPATLAAQNINHGLKQVSEGNGDAKVNIMAHRNGDLLVRALTSNRYARIWNYEVLERMLPLEAEGWTCPTPFKGATGFRSVGAYDKPDPTVYVSDHDMFAFLVQEDHRIAEPGNPEGLARGFFVENSEVGASALRVTTFLYRYMCCNHIVWGAKDVSELAVRHIGKARGNLSTMFLGLTEYLNESASDVEAKIRVAKSKTIEADKDKVLDYVFAKLRGKVGREAIEQGYDTGLQFADTDGDPRTYWGLSQGMTRYSQTLQFADARMEVDKAAAQVIEMAF